ncbi:MAG: LacI family transcriptional regulator, partial [Anaerolineae bacterium]|nr:LacI family transcriptional regulator [Anaerolineae bacterium]
MVEQKPRTFSNTTIADVARQAGVSISTVSRVLNDKPDVSEQTRQRIQAVIDTLRYTPYVQATRRLSRSLTLSANYPLEHYLHASSPLTDSHFFGGMGSAAGELGYALNITTRRMTPEALLRPFEDDQIDGMIVMEVDQDDWRVELLREVGCPFVLVGRCADNTDLSFVDIDTDSSVMRLFDHLVNLGHRHIGFLAHPENVIREGFTPAVHGLRSYQRAVAAHGLESYVCHAVFGPVGGFEAASSLLDQADHLTALITMDGVGAPGIFRALQQRGYQIPQDFSVAGCVVGTNLAEMMIPT